MWRYKIEQTPCGNWIVSMRMSVFDKWQTIGETASLEAALFYMSMTLQLQGGKVKIIPFKGVKSNKFFDIEEYNSISHNVGVIEAFKRITSIFK